MKKRNIKLIFFWEQNSNSGYLQTSKQPLRQLYQQMVVRLILKLTLTHKEDNLSLRKHEEKLRTLIADSRHCHSQPPWKLVALKAAVCGPLYQVFQYCLSQKKDDISSYSGENLTNQRAEFKSQSKTRNTSVMIASCLSFPKISSIHRLNST